MRGENAQNKKHSEERTMYKTQIRNSTNITLLNQDTNNTNKKTGRNPIWKYQKTNNTTSLKDNI